MNKTLNIPVPRDHPEYMTYYRKIRGAKMKQKQKEWAETNRNKETARWRKWYSKIKKSGIYKYSSKRPKN